MNPQIIIIYSLNYSIILLLLFVYYIYRSDRARWVDAVTPVKTVDTERIYEEWGKAIVFYCKVLYKCIVLMWSGCQAVYQSLVFISLIKQYLVVNRHHKTRLDERHGCKWLGRQTCNWQSVCWPEFDPPVASQKNKLYCHH